MHIIRFISDDEGRRTLQGVDHGDGTASVITGSIFDPTPLLGPRTAIRKLLAPIVPPNIICVGRNYPPTPRPPVLIDAELEVFLKPTTALQNPGDPIVRPNFGDLDPQLDAEGELAVVIGREARNIAESEALLFVLGYTIANDVTAKVFQTTAGAPVWTRGKGFDTFCPLGPAIVTPDEVGDPSDLEIRTLVDGVVTRQGRTSQMIWSVPRIIATLSRRITLLPGTVILTGAPGCINGRSESSLASDSSLRVEIDRLGALDNRVI